MAARTNTKVFIFWISIPAAEAAISSPPLKISIALIALPNLELIRFLLKKNNMDINIRRDNFIRDSTKRLIELRKIVLNARTSLNVVFWNYPTIAIANIDAALRNRLKEIEKVKDTFRKKLITKLTSVPVIFVGLVSNLTLPP